MSALATDDLRFVASLISLRVARSANALFNIDSLADLFELLGLIFCHHLDAEVWPDLDSKAFVVF